MNEQAKTIKWILMFQDREFSYDDTYEVFSWLISADPTV